MELVWNNPSPNRTVYRPPVWEVINRDGTRRVISGHEVQAIVKSKVDHGAKDVLNQLKARVPFFNCF